MSHTTEDRTREEGVRRLSTDEDPRGSQHRDDVYRVDLRPKKAKTSDRAEEERLRIEILTHHEPSD